MSTRRLPVLAAVSAAGLASLIAVPLASAGGMYDVSTCRATVGERHYSGADAAQTAVTAAEALSANATVRISGTCAPVVIDDAVTPHTITLRGAGRNPTLDGQGNPGSVVTVTDGTTAVIRGLKITGGTGAVGLVTTPSEVGYGGGIHNDGTLTVRNSRVTGNAATGAVSEGGGIFSAGPLTVIDSRVDGNAATYAGGGIAAHDTLTVRGSRVDGNTAAIGGGIWVFTGPPKTASITNSRISGNTGSQSGGIESNGYTLTILRSQVNGNTASDVGGGGIVNNFGGTLTLTKSQVNRNTTAGVGGGIANASGGSVSLVESQVNWNSAGVSGGGIYNGYPGGGPSTVTLCPKSKVQHNTAGGHGGGIWTATLGTILNGPALTTYSGTGVGYNTSIDGTSAGNSPTDQINIFGNTP